MERFYVTTPIYYVNAKPHLGHAYTTIVVDALARFNRAMGRDVRFLTGTDEHGDKIVQAAEKAGVTPKQYVDEISGLFSGLWPKLDISNDDFIRTTEPRHIKVVQEILQKVHDSGDIYHGYYEGHYCYGCERFLTDKELEDGTCPDHKTAPELIREKNYFFKMSKYQNWLLEHIKANPGFIRPERYEKEVVALLESGSLEDLCISRPKTRLTWGVELPFDTDYVCYVWFDALINYVAALGGPDSDEFAAYWPQVQHVVAKDILKPHGIFWPTMLKAAGLPVYQHLNVHGYWLVDQTKMSKSLGNVVDPAQMAETYGIDAFRFFLLKEMHFGSDASYSEEAFIGRFNADLANDLGNLANRSLNMLAKYFGSTVPEAAFTSDAAADMRELCLNACANFQSLFSQCRFDRALEALWEVVRALNKYIDSSAPWALMKNGQEAEAAEALVMVLACLRKIALHLTPVMPATARTMLEQLGCAGQGDANRLGDELASLEPLPAGTQVAAASNLFPRLEPPKKEEPAPKPEKKAKKDKKAAPSKSAGPAESIEFDDFAKLDLRIGKVTAAEQHPKADRLLVLTIDLGEAEPRQIVSGLAEHYKPADLIGRLVTVVANLKPIKLRGVQSQGMVLTAEADGALELLAPTGDIGPGGKVK